MRRRQLNPRQRQGLLLVMIAAAGLLGVFLLIANYVAGVSKQVGPKTQILVLIRPLPAYHAVSTADLGEITVPVKWAPANALTEPSEALGLVSTTQLQAGTDLQGGMLSELPTVQPGDQEAAFTIDAETGVAGQLQPGSLVDVVAVYGSGGRAGKGYAEFVARDVRVVNVGQLGGSGSAPIILSLSPQQSLAISYAESTASKMRFVLDAQGSSTTPAPVPPYSPSPTPTP
jgi:pilus assembly protein CpaB